MKNYFNLILALSSLIVTQAHAYDPVIRTFHSVRAAGMGDVRYTTGLFEENLFANPARSTENPENLFQLPKISVEVGTEALSQMSALTKGGKSGLSEFSTAVGKPISDRIQLVFPGFYKRHFWTDNWTMGLAMVVSQQTVAAVHQNATIDPTTVISAGPAFNLARRFLEEDRLSVGATVHAEYRASSGSTFGVRDFLTGTNISDELRGGSGLAVNLDLGTTFRPHWTFLDFEYEIGAAVNNVNGGYGKNYSKARITGWSKDPIGSPRSYSFGVSATNKLLPFFDSYTFAAELTDLGNQNGSVYKCMHLGTEEKWKILAARLGINQGYFTAGFGIDLVFFDLNVATYGEELGMNAGTLQDRRYALELGFKI